MKESDSSFREAPTRRGSDSQARRAIDVPVQLLRDQRGVYGIGISERIRPRNPGFVVRPLSSVSYSPAGLL